MYKGHVVNENNKKGSRAADVFTIHMVAENMHVVQKCMIRKLEYQISPN